MTEDRTASTGALWPLLAAIGVLLIYNAPLLLMRGIGLGGDGIRQYYPAEYALANALRAGTLPFWTPDLQAGFPLLAEGQPGAVYPLNLLALGLLPTPVAHNLLIVTHQLLGLLGMFWWGRTVGISRAAATLMALVFAFTTVLAANDILTIETTTWIPFLFATAERYVQRGTPSLLWVVPLTGLQWLGGFPQIAVYTALATHIYVAGRVCVEPRSWSRRAGLVAAWAVASLVGVLLAAPQLLPQYELSLYSIRAGGIHGALAGERSLFPGALLTAVLPSWRAFFNNAGLGSGFYCGLLPCLFGVAMVLRRPRVAYAYPLLAVIVVTTVLAFGRYTPLFALTRRLPGFAYFRLPSRALVFSQFGLLTFFGLAWDQMATAAPAPLRRAVQRLLAAAAALMLINGIVLYPLLRRLQPWLRDRAVRYTQQHILLDPYHVQPLAYYQGKIDALYATLLEAASLGQAQALIALTVALAAWATLYRVREAPSARWRQIVWVGLILVEVVFAAGGFHPVDDSSWVTARPATVSLVKPADSTIPCRSFRLVDDPAATLRTQDLALLPANWNLLVDVPTTGVYAPLGFAAYEQLMRRLGTVDLSFGYRPVTPEDVTRDRALLDFLNVCYLLSRQPLSGFAEVARIDEVLVYHNDRALPRAFAVDQVVRVDSVDAALAWVREHPDGLRDSAVIEGALAAPPERGAAQATSVRVVDYQAEAVRVEVSAPGAVMLVLTDSYYPGWQAQVDGVAAPLYRTHGVFRAVAVPAGAHRVEFRYEPTTFWQGVAIAAAAAGISIVWGVAVLWWRTARRTGPVRV